MGQSQVRSGATSESFRFLNDRIKTVLIRLLEGRDDDDIFSSYYRANGPEDIKDTALSARLEVDKVTMVESISIFSVAAGEGSAVEAVD